MTVEFTFGDYFRLCRPRQLSSDLSLHRNAFWKFQGSGHPSAKYFSASKQGIEWSLRAGMSKICRHPQHFSFLSQGWFPAVIPHRILQSMPSGKFLLPDDFEEGSTNGALAKHPISLLSTCDYPRPRLCNSAWHHQFWWCFFTLIYLIIRLCCLGGEDVSISIVTFSWLVT